MKDSTHIPVTVSCADLPPGSGAAGPALLRRWRALGLGNTLLLALALCLLHYLLHSAAADIPANTSLSALAWPAPAIGVAMMWQRPRRQWPLFLLAIGTGVFLVGQLDWLPWSVDLLFALLSVVAVGLGTLAARHWLGTAAVPDSTAQLLRFMLVLPGGITALIAALFATALWWTLDAQWLQQTARIYAALALAFMTVLPALLPRADADADAAPSPHARAIGLAGVGTLALGLVPDMPEEAVRALLALTLTSAALRLMPQAVARLLALIAGSLVGLSLLDLGPYVERNGLDVWALQLDLIGLGVLSLGLAVALQERRRLALQLEQTRRIEALGFLAGGIAHDFNNLLGTIGACAEITAEQWPADKAPPAPLHLLEDQVLRGREMTQELLLAARQGDPQRSAVALAPLLDEVLAAARALCPAHVRITMEQAPDPELCVQANASQLRRAVQNLVRNAIQAARSEVRLSTGAATEAVHADPGYDAAAGALARGPTAWIEVADDGSGIDATHWPHLFDPFYSTRRGAGGTGLGLAIVAGVACSHDACVGMRTTAGRGTRFRLALPQTSSLR